MNKIPKVMASGDTCKFLGISRKRLKDLVKKYDIPYQVTSAGKIFFEKDLIEFQESRKENMKHGRKE